MIRSQAASISPSRTSRRYLVTKTRWTWRLQATLRPRRISGSGAQRGDIDKMLPAARIVTVKLVVPVRLYPGAAQEAALRDTLALCNKAADLVSAQASGMRVTSKRSLQRLVYGDLKAMGLSAQPAIQVARKVSGRSEEHTS